MYMRNAGASFLSAMIVAAGLGMFCPTERGVNLSVTTSNRAIAVDFSSPRRAFAAVLFRKRGHTGKLPFRLTIVTAARGDRCPT